MPHYIIIGAMKSGTTSLYRYLIQHPAIIPAAQKGIHFFDFNYHKGISWYKSQFPSLSEPKKHFTTGEASPYYMFHPHVPKRIYETIPNVKLIALLRNPVDRAYSHYKFSKKVSNKVTFEEAISLELQGLQKEREKLLKDETYQSEFYRLYSILSRGIYVDQLKAFGDYFSKEKILIIKSEDFFKNPNRVVNQVFKFLEVPQYNINQVPIYNKGQYKPLDDSLNIYLSDYFKPHNQRLYDYLGTDFGWD